MFSNKNFLLIITTIIVCFFLVSGYFLLDPDFGWHLAMGELIIQGGLPSSDPFSYTMTSYPVIDHEWIQNIFLYLAHKNIDTFGLNFLFALSVILTFYLIKKTLELYEKKYSDHFFAIAIIPSAGSLFPFFGIRPQVVAWTLFAGWLYLILSKKFLTHHFLFLPFYIVLWTNLHGSFPLTLVTLILVLTVRIIVDKKISVRGIILLTLCVLATGVNPYGFSVWHEVWQTITDSELKWRIAEWTPTIFSAHLSFIFLATLSLPLQYTYWKKLPKQLLLINVFLFVQAVSSMRHIPFWVIANVPLLILSFNFFKRGLKQIKYGQERLQTSLKYLMYLSLALFIFQSTLHIKNTSLVFSEKNFYPIEAIEYLKKQPNTGHIFASYQWGGYLIWKYPEKKVFIDGRMPSWSYESSKENESNNAMADYINIMTGRKHYQPYFEQYNVTTVLLPNTNEKKITTTEQLSKKTSESFDIDSTRFNLSKQLEIDGWKKVYSDDVTVIYQQEK